MPFVNAPDRLLAAGVFREEARREGFSRIGFAPAETPARFDRFERWLRDGHHAGMTYLEETRAARSSPQSLLPGARSVICLAAPHRKAPFAAADGSKIARYAAGADYHGTLRQRTERLVSAASRRLGSFRRRVCVDSTPLAERSLAARAGLGWIGKNGCLIDAETGSWLLLAEILTDLDLPFDEPAADRCGSCVRCLDACPTHAFVEPGIMDSRRCLAYWTIEHRGPMPEPVQASIGDRVFGCDICQEVCPWNSALFGGGDDRPAPTRREWLAMGPGQWRREWGATALNRAGRRGVQRNAAASAGSVLDETCLPALQRSARVAEPALSAAARLALHRISQRKDV